MVDRFRPIKLSSFAGLQNWGIEDVTRNGDNILRDWRIKGARRKIWRASKEEAEHAARELNAHPEIIQKDERQEARSGKTAAILNKQRATRTHGATRVAPKFNRCDACGMNYRGEHACT